MLYLTCRITRCLNSTTLSFSRPTARLFTAVQQKKFSQIPTPALLSSCFLFLFSEFHTYQHLFLSLWSVTSNVYVDIAVGVKFESRVVEQVQLDLQSLAASSALCRMHRICGADFQFLKKERGVQLALWRSLCFPFVRALSTFESSTMTLTVNFESFFLFFIEIFIDLQIKF